jgi:hypothetical protein
MPKQGMREPQCATVWHQTSSPESEDLGMVAGQPAIHESMEMQGVRRQIRRMGIRNRTSATPEVKNSRLHRSTF